MQNSIRQLDSISRVCKGKRRREVSLNERVTYYRKGLASLGYCVEEGERILEEARK